MANESRYRCPLCGRRLVVEPDGMGRFIVSCPDEECTDDAHAGSVGTTEAEAYVHLLGKLREETE